LRRTIPHLQFVLCLVLAIAGCSSGSSAGSKVGPTPAPALAATTTSLSASAITAQQGIPVTLAAVAAPALPGAAIPTGTIAFSDGAAALGSAPVDLTGRAILTTAKLSPGPHTVTAAYSGDTADAPSASPSVALSVTAPASPTFTNPLTLNVAGVGAAVSCADPAILKTTSTSTTAGSSNTWYLYCTSDALSATDLARHYINIFETTDLIHYKYDGDAFTGLPVWAPNGQLWAPAIKVINGQYLLFYASPSSNLAGSGAAIGVGVSSSPKGPFVDHGVPVVEPQPTSPSVCCNGRFRSTIDPDEIQDASGQRYLLFGSFDGGIFVRKLSADGLTTDPGSEVRIAADNRYEGGNWWFHGGFFYLFASSTNCCNGPLSGYNVFVGRASTPLGPFLDQQGNSLNGVNPGGNIALAQNGNSFVGPGGNVLFTDEAGQDYILYHAIPLAQPFYTGRALYTARPALLDAIDWIDGWPVTRGGYGPSDSASPQPAPAAQPGSGNAYTAPAPNPIDAPQTLIPALSDEFNTTTLSPQWSFLHGAQRYTLNGSAYTIPTVAADSLGVLANLPLLTEPAPATDYIVETRLSVDLPVSGSGNNYAQAGLLLYGSDTNLMRLDLYSNSDTRQIEFYKQTAPAASGYPSAGATNLGPPALSTTPALPTTVDAWLRIAKRTVDGKETYTAYSSQDGRTWTRGGTWINSLGSSARICLYAGNRPGFTASFDYVHVSALQ